MRLSKKKLILGIFALLAVFITACSPKVVYLPSDTVVEYRDTTIWKTDTLSVEVPVERIVEVTPKDTLVMETSVAKSVSFYNKEIRMLQGSLENKKVALQKEYVYKDRIVTKDSIVTKEVPVPVEVEKKVVVVPWIYKVLSVIGLLALCVAAAVALKAYIEKRVF